MNVKYHFMKKIMKKSLHLKSIKHPSADSKETCVFKSHSTNRTLHHPNSDSRMAEAHNIDGTLFCIINPPASVWSRRQSKRNKSRLIFRLIVSFAYKHVYRHTYTHAHTRDTRHLVLAFPVFAHIYAGFISRSTVCHKLARARQRQAFFRLFSSLVLAPTFSPSPALLLFPFPRALFFYLFIGHAW